MVWHCAWCNTLLGFALHSENMYKICMVNALLAVGVAYYVVCGEYKVHAGSHHLLPLVAIAFNQTVNQTNCIRYARNSICCHRGVAIYQGYRRGIVTTVCGGGRGGTVL